MATTTTAAKPSAYGHGGSSTTTEPEWVTQVLSERKPSTDLPGVSDMYRAPENMRLADKDEKIYEPVLVAIGPFHHGKFPAMDQHKTRVLNSMMDRLENMNQRKFLMELDDVLRRDEEEMRGCYSESFPKSFDFVEMMVLDGCFILEIFRMHAGLYRDHFKDDPINKARWMLPAIALDMVKIENQLPCFVLDVLYEITKLPEEATLNYLAGSFLASLCPGLDELVIEDDRPQDRTHLLSLVYSTFLPNPNHRRIPINDKGKRLNSFPSVTDLCLSGIKVVRKKEWRNILEIKYINGKLEIPKLVIDHSTKILMRNLVAYEQCNKLLPDLFTSYVTFMDALVNSAEDVEVLRVAGVINHFMNSNEDVSILINSLTGNIKYDMNKGYLADLNAQIYRDHHSAWPQFKARFRRLVNSREGIVYIFTVFSAYLTVLQTVFTVLSYVLPR